MKLIANGETRWVLFSASAGDSEERHIRDLAFGVMCLEAAGVQPADIYFYIDGKHRNLISQWISTGTNNNYNIKESKDFFVDQKTNKYKNLVMFVTGHGSIDGIYANPVIKPHILLQSIKTSPNLECAAAYLGQCSAGIFNYIPAGRSQKGEPDVIFMGATNLHESLSLATQANFLTGSQAWAANVFLLNVFRWIAAPADVDGDGLNTVMDSYKYAGKLANEGTKNLRISSFSRAIKFHDEWITVQNTYNADPTNLNNKVKLMAAQKMLSTELDLRYTHQECWILNSLPAQKWEF